ncbi:MAG: nuclear transport factor 2 family protein [Xenococcaceae cyanobacterium MO_188.B29]|nr:nuclear transport factor 2 family protein [Xenococcaceae cyanobacterium MO_188.B29]
MNNKLTISIGIALAIAMFSFFNTSEVQGQVSITESVEDIMPQSPSARIAQQLLQNLEAKNADAIAQLWTQEAIYELPYALPGNPSQLQGKEAAQQNIIRIIAMFERIEFEQVRFYPTQDPNIVLVETQGNFVVAGSGKAYRNKYIAVIQTQNDRIVLLREYFNPLIIAETFGINLAPN